MYTSVWHSNPDIEIEWIEEVEDVKTEVINAMYSSIMHSSAHKSELFRALYTTGCVHKSLSLSSHYLHC